MEHIDSSYMSTKFEPKYFIMSSLLMKFNKSHYVPLLYGGELDLIRIFEDESKSCLPMSMGEMLDFGIDPFEDLSNMYDLDEEEE